MPMPEVLMKILSAFPRSTTLVSPVTSFTFAAVGAAVTGRTTNSFCHVNTVVEINVIRQIIDAVPLQRRVANETLANGSQYRGLAEKLRVTTHAGLTAGHPGESRFLDRVMTKTAIYSIVADMMFVAEGNRLIKRHIDVSGIRRPKDFGGYPAGATNH
jgi:hypothetical protein